MIMEFFWEGKCSVGAHSLLNGMKQVSGSECSCDRPSDPSSDLCGNNGRIITYGISSSNEWHAESVRPNLQGGSDYILVGAIVSSLPKIATLKFVLVFLKFCQKNCYHRKCKS